MPPPPPPPPPPKITVNESHPPPSMPSGLPTPVPPPSGPFGNIMQSPVRPFYPTIAQPVLSHATSTPWWIPTDADSTDVYAQWYANSYKNAAAAQGTPVTTTATTTPPQAEKLKAKNKFLKRKTEPIDPRADAGKKNRFFCLVKKLNFKKAQKENVIIKIIIFFCRKSRIRSKGIIGINETIKMRLVQCSCKFYFMFLFIFSLSF